MYASVSLVRTVGDSGAGKGGMHSCAWVMKHRCDVMRWGAGCTHCANVIVVVMLGERHLFRGAWQDWPMLDTETDRIVDVVHMFDKGAVEIG